MIHHIEINVSNLQRSTNFWGWLLQSFGYMIYQKWEQGISWRLNDTYLVFVQTQERFVDESFHRCRTGLNHLAFYGESKAHIDELKQLL